MEATRGKGKTNAYLTARAHDRFGALSRAWDVDWAKSLNKDISSTSWAQVSTFTEIVAEIKDVRSPVFTSKFCHLLLPQVFPIVDMRAMGNPFATYETCFEFVKQEWSSTSQTTQTVLRTTLNDLLGATKISTYPTTNKIVELCLIGRRHMR